MVDEFDLLRLAFTPQKGQIDDSSCPNLDCSMDQLILLYPNLALLSLLDSPWRDWDIPRTFSDPRDQKTCQAQALVSNFGPGSQALVDNFSAFSYLPSSGHAGGAWKTAAESLAVKGGILKWLEAYGRVLDFNGIGAGALIQEGASGTINSLGQAGLVLGALGTMMDVKSKYDCK